MYRMDHQDQLKIENSTTISRLFIFDQFIHQAQHNTAQQTTYTCMRAHQICEPFSRDRRSSFSLNVSICINSN